jgi:hypothetical protein
LISVVLNFIQQVFLVVVHLGIFGCQKIVEVGGDIEGLSGFTLEGGTIVYFIGVTDHTFLTAGIEKNERGLTVNASDPIKVRICGVTIWSCRIGKGCR